MKSYWRLLILAIAAALVLSVTACGASAPEAPASSGAEGSSTVSEEVSSQETPSSLEESSQEASSSLPEASGESQGTDSGAEASAPEGSSQSSQAQGNGNNSGPEKETAGSQPAGGGAAQDIPDFMLPGAADASQGGGSGSGSGNGTITVTISVECSEAAGYDIPCDVNVLDATLTLKSGASVYDALKTAAKDAGIAVAGSSSYIKGIAGLYEKDCDGQGGWTYTVNGEFPSVGCSSYKLSDGDSILWSYVVDTSAW